jgi:hypothetical protein
MLHVTEFDVRMQEHSRRADDVNSNGWLRSSSAGTGRMMMLDTDLSAIGPNHVGARRSWGGERGHEEWRAEPRVASMWHCG